MKKLILLILSLVVAFLISELIVSGAFKEVTLLQEERGPYLMIYQEHVGAYHKIVPAIEAVEKWAQGQSIPCSETFGEYHDNPKEVDQERLRSSGGCLFDLSTKSDWALWVKNAESSNLRTKKLEKKKYVVALFSGSPRIGPLKVYPKVFDYIEKNRLKMAGVSLEIYKILPEEKGIHTTYLFPEE